VLSTYKLVRSFHLHLTAFCAHRQISNETPQQDVTIKEANLLTVLNKQALSKAPTAGMHEWKWFKGNMINKNPTT